MPSDTFCRPAPAESLEQRAEQAEQAARYADASLLWQQLVQKSGKPLYARRHIDCLVQAGQLAEAATCSQAYAERWPFRPVFVRTQLEFAYYLQAWDRMDSLWAQLADCAGERSDPALWLIRQRLKAKDYGGALHAAEQAMRFWGNEERLRQRYQDLQYLYGTDSKIDRPVQSPNLEAPDLDAEAAMLALQQHADESSCETVIPLLQAMLQRWPDYRPAIRMLLECWQRESSYEEIAVFCQRRYEQKQKHEPFSLLQWVLALSALGRIGQAVALVREAEAQGSMANVVQQLLINTIGQGLSATPELRTGLKTLCSEHGVEGLAQATAFEVQLRPPQRPLIPSFDATQAVVASPRTRSSCMAIVFTGYGRRLGNMPQALLDRFFAGHGIAMVRLVDKSGRMYLEGLPELGGSFESTIGMLHQMADEYGASRIVTIGNSGGGMGALRYGVALNASHVLAFSPAVNLDIDFLEAHSDYRARAAIRKLNRLFPGGALDARRLIEASDFAGRIDLYAGAKSREDQCQILHLSGLKHVYLHAVDGVSSHNSLGPAVLNGTFLDALQRIVS